MSVADGDTVTILDSKKSQTRIRLHAIDAPESNQPFGQVSKKALSELVFGKDIVVIVKDTDRYGRTVGRIIVDGVDANLAMIEAGLAWHFKQYDKDPTFAAAEIKARAAKKGLWADEKPVPPWDWRRDEKAGKVKGK